MYTHAAAQIIGPAVLPDTNLPLARSGGIKRATAPATLGRTPLAGSPGSRTGVPEERARFAQEWPIAVSRGWESVMDLLESSSPDPEVQRLLRDLTAD